MAAATVLKEKVSPTRWALVAGGLTNPQIAERLGLSDNTVKFHVQHLFSKLGVKNRTEAALKYAHGR